MQFPFLGRGNRTCRSRASVGNGFIEDLYGGLICEPKVRLHVIDTFEHSEGVVAAPFWLAVLFYLVQGNVDQPSI
jgi:hypothetical protein